MQELFLWAGLVCLLRWVTAARAASVEQIISVKKAEEVYFKAFGQSRGFISCFFRTGMGKMGHCFEGESLLLEGVFI